MLLTDFQRAIKKCELVTPFFRLPHAPGSLAHPNHIHAGRRDTRKIPIPTGLRPLLRVIDDPVEKRVVTVAFVHIKV